MKKTFKFFYKKLFLIFFLFSLGIGLSAQTTEMNKEEVFVTDFGTHSMYQFKIDSPQFEERLNTIGPDFPRQLERKYQSLPYVLDIRIDEAQRMMIIELKNDLTEAKVKSTLTDFNQHLRTFTSTN